MRLLLFFLFILGALPLKAEQLQPFTTDGCSWFPDGNFTDYEKWHHCCVQHDYAYWQGGTAQERLDADQKLGECVAAVGEKTIGTFMYFGVRVGGLPIWPTTFRWGYGWPYPWTYRELTASEIEQVMREGRRSFLPQNLER